VPFSDWVLASLGLAIIALGSTVIILTIEFYYGRQLSLAYGGPLLAAAASAIFAIWFVRRHRR
jgi:hypothetical protein